MADHWSTTRKHHDEPAGSDTAARLVLLVFVTAAVLGLVTGVAWVVWNLL